MKQLILNADDFGRHAAINEAVERGFREGLLRSATVMAGEPAFADAVAVAERNAGLSVGLHCTLVDGRPVLPPEEVPSLVRGDGCFYPDHNAFFKRFFLGKIAPEEVRRELAAQLAKAEGAGLRLTHLDSHQHLHTLPGVIDIVVELAVKAKISALRIPTTDVFPAGIGIGEIVPGVARLGLRSLAERSRRKGRKAGLRMPEHFAGLVAGSAFTISHMLELCQNLPEGTTEVMLHPGLDNVILQQVSHWQHDFLEEFRTITNAALPAELAGRQIEVVNFAAL